MSFILYESDDGDFEEIEMSLVGFLFGIWYSD